MALPDIDQGYGAIRTVHCGAMAPREEPAVRVAGRVRRGRQGRQHRLWVERQPSTEKQLGVRMPWRRQHLVSGAALDYLAPVHHQDPV